MQRQHAAAFAVSFPRFGISAISSAFNSSNSLSRQPQKWNVMDRTRRSFLIVSSTSDVGMGSADTPSADASEASKKKSKTEKIAEMLGQSKESMEDASVKVQEQKRRGNLKKYGLALGTTIVAVSLFFLEKLDPNAGGNLLRFLQANSSPQAVVGMNERPSFVEFSASWCDNCKHMAQSVYELENVYSDRVNFVVVDGDDPINSDIVDRYGVDGIPQFSMVDKNGKVKANLIGRIPKEILVDDLEALIGENTLPFPGLTSEELAKALSQG